MKMGIYTSRVGWGGGGWGVQGRHENAKCISSPQR